MTVAQDPVVVAAAAEVNLFTNKQAQIFSVPAFFILFYVSYFDVGLIFYDPVVTAAGGPVVNFDTANISTGFACFKNSIFYGVLPASG